MNAADIRIDTDASFLLIGDSGTKKTSFIATCPQPSFTFDFDKGMAVHRGNADIFYDTFKELPKGQAIDPKGTRFTQAEGWYEWGKAWPAFLKRINEIGREIDSGTCVYQTLAIDSLTLMTDACMNYVLRENNRTVPEIRDWGAFLSNMSAVFSQLTAWPLVKVFTAHIKRDENQVTGAIEQLPLVPGQFAGKVSVYFDEVYFCQVGSEPVKPGSTDRVTKWFLKTTPDAVYKQAKSRKYNLPNGTPTDFQEIQKIVATRAA